MLAGSTKRSKTGNDPETHVAQLYSDLLDSQIIIRKIMEDSTLVLRSMQRVVGRVSDA